MRPSLCAGRVLVLCAQFGETVLPAEAAQQPGSPFGGGAIASGELVVWQVESLDRRSGMSHGRLPVRGASSGASLGRRELGRADAKMITVTL
jgi:hypothetical protein